jgi:hypothetical protein
MPRLFKPECALEQLPAGGSLFFIQLLVILAVARLIGAIAPQLQLFAADYWPLLNLGAQMFNYLQRRPLFRNRLQ